VSAALRGQGVATELLRQLADWFVTSHAYKICVDAKPRNPDVRAFYTHLGAEPINDHWLIWPDITRIER
jgi:GNAT superfamily N-acetyltransferase